MIKFLEKHIEAFVKLFLVILTLGILSSCTTYRLSTLYHDPIYGPEEVVIQVPSNVTIDTLSYSQLKWKLRTDNTFRWNFAQYAMDQPLSWYNSNFRYSYWRPFNSFDVYWNRHNFWYDWAFNYPFNYGWSWNTWNRWNFGWGHWNHWNRPFYHWDNWYNGPWHNPSYNAIWNSSRNNVNVAYINGRRGSRSIINRNITITNNRNNNNIQNNIITRYNQPRRIINNNVDEIVNDIRLNNNNIKIRVYNNPNNFENDQIIRNNSRINWPSQSSNNGWGSGGRQIVPSRSTIPTISNPVQSGQIHRGSGTSVPQQSRSSQSSSGQGRGSCSRC